MTINARTTLTSFVVNGDPQEVSVTGAQTLLNVLREDLHLTGTKCGCNQGICGACTVLCDGMPIRACLALAMVVDGRDILTVEGGKTDHVLCNAASVRLA